MDFRLLGPLMVQAEGGHLPLGGPRQRLVLALLLQQPNEVVPVDQLVDDMWGEEPPPGARATLYAYVSRLRTALGRQRINTRAGGYVLRADAREIDARRFEILVTDARRLMSPDPGAAAIALDEALALWRGPAYADLGDEPSLRAEIARLEELRLSALEARVAARLAIGRHAEVITDLERLLVDYPLRERLWAQLMVALYRSGRQSEALEAYLRARRMLADQLGVDPSPELERLQQQILRQEPALDVYREAIRGYEVHERVGEGAFGTVYRAGQPGLGREVAIKLIHPQLANDADFIRRFEQEAQLIAGLEHPHVVPLYDYWREPGSAYLVMRFLRGGNLSERIASGGPLAPADVLQVVDQVAAALAAAHRQGIVHRDVRPPNILFDEDGNAYLSDFGIARQGLASADRQEVTSTGLAYYLAPEDIAGESVSAATDLYSLGLVVFEMLAGRHPLADTPPEEAIDHHLQGTLPSLASVRPDLPAAVENVLRRATAREPTARYIDPLALAEALRSALAAVGETAMPTELAQRNPYKGLRPYGEADAPDFFGRETVVKRLVARLGEEGDEARFLAIVGPSGSGKSSLVRAGLVPALRAGGLSGSADWFYIEMHPGARPFDALAEALLRVASLRPTGLARRLERDPAGLPALVAELLPTAESELLLVIDQFEELFTITGSEDERVAFLDAIAAVVAGPASRVRTVLTLRADFFDRPLLYRVFGDLLAARTEVVTPFSPEELTRAVVGPAERVGLAVEPALVAQIVADAAQSAGSLPLLQYTLSELFERQDEGVLTLAAYRHIGGLVGAVGRRADQLVARLDPAAREAVRQVFLRLLTITEEGTTDVRRRVLLTELAGLELSGAAMQRVLDVFSRHRLLLFDRDPSTRGPTVEVAHEALLRAWGRLRAWIESARDDVRTHRLLAAAAAEWEAGDRDESFLPRGSRLDRFESWAATSLVALTEAERGFLEAAVALRQAEEAAEDARREREVALERRSRVRLRAVAALMAFAALVAVGLSLYAFQQQRLAFARELAAAAVANLEVDPELSILLARQAVDATRGLGGLVLPEAEEALHRGVVASRIVHRVTQSGGVVDWSPDGGTFLVTGARPVIELTAAADAQTNMVWLYDRASGALVRSWAAQPAGVNGGLFSPQGSYVATAGKDGTVVLWNPSGSPVRTLAGPDGWVWGLSFSADEKYLAGVWSGRSWSSALIWDVISGDLIRQIDGLQAGGSAQDTSLDSRGARIAVASFSASGTRTYDVATGQAVDALLPPDLDRHPWGWSAVAWSPDDLRIAAAQSNLVRIYDADGGAQRHSFDSGAGWITSLAWSADGSRLLVANTDGNATVWQVGSDSAALVLALAGQSSGLIGADLSPDGGLAVTADAGGEVGVWDVTDAGTAEWLNLPAEPTWLSTVIFGRDGRTMLGSLPGAKLGVWDASSGAVLMTIEGHGPAPGEEGLPSIASVSISPDGTRAVTGGRDWKVKLWDAATGAFAGEFAGHTGWVEDTQFNPLGDLLATAGDETVRILDAVTLRQLRALHHDGPALAARFTHDGSRLVSGSLDETVRVWDPYTGELLRRIDVGWQVRDLSVDPQGRLVGVGGDGGVALYDLGSGELLHTVTGQSGEVWAVRFSPDGRQVASGGIDGTIRLWDPATGVVRLRLIQERVDDIAFSPDGKRLAAIGGGLIRVWALRLDDLLEISERNVARTLTDEECLQYLHAQACP